MRLLEVLGAFITGYAACVWRVSGAMERSLTRCRGRVDNQLLDASDDLFWAVFPRPLGRLIDRHAQRKAGG